MNNQNSKALFERAQKSIPGGVNSPVRAFRAVGGNPLFIKSAKGAYITDEDDNQYIELINSWGPMILGHANEMIEEAVRGAISASLSFGAPTAKEVEIAELIVDMVPSVERVRMVNSGTEATMSAIRVARGFTGRDKILKFEGCYHGHGDSFLIAAGSGAVTLGTPDSPGVTKGTAGDTISVLFNNLASVEQALIDHKDQVAAIILEPVAGNMGCVLPQQGFLAGLRKLCDEHNVLLIFDEVMTGFRLAKGGAQELYGVTPDMTTLGKIIGGGMPVGAYGGRAEIMNYVSPVGPVYQAGTLSGNPIAMAAGLAMLHYLNDHDEVYTWTKATTDAIVAGTKQNLAELGLDYTINQQGSMFSLFFTTQKVNNFEDAKTSDTELFGKYFRGMLDRGVYLPPSQYEALFISTALGQKEIDAIVKANREVLEELKDE
ncbi:MAG: glutamate-1-semialdehyde 2,1-aminomutase [Cyclobacteriaceae bacterium]